MPTDANPYHEMNDLSSVPENSNDGNGDDKLRSGDERSKIGVNNDQSRSYTCMRKLKELYEENEFLLLILIAIVTAKIYPPLGAEYLYPDITADWISVMFIFCEYFESFMFFFKIKSA